MSMDPFLGGSKQCLSSYGSPLDVLALEGAAQGDESGGGNDARERGGLRRDANGWVWRAKRVEKL